MVVSPGCSLDRIDGAEGSRCPEGEGSARRDQRRVDQVLIFKKRSPADGTPCGAVRVRTSARPTRGSKWILSRFSTALEGGATLRIDPEEASTEKTPNSFHLRGRDARLRAVPKWSTRHLVYAALGRPWQTAEWSLQDFVYERPETIGEAIAAMRADDARAFAGGTDLVPQLREGRRRAARIVDLKHIPEMTAITVLPDGSVSIGAAATATAVARHTAIATGYPAVAEAALLIGGVQVQNRASLGGNICNAAPSADGVPALICHGAQAQIASPKGTRGRPVEASLPGPG